MWSKSPATSEEPVTRGMSHGDGYPQGCADELSKPPPSRLLLHTSKCAAGGRMMYNSDDEFQLFSKSLGKQGGCSVLAVGKEGAAIGSE